MNQKFASVLIAFLLIAGFAMAQVPQGVNFQGIARDATGLALQQGTVIGLRLSVLQGNASGSTVYSEEHSSITLGRGGVFNAVMGKGTVLTGTFSGINWQTGSKFLRIEMRQGAGSYTALSTTEIMSVPYAQTSGNGIVSANINGQGQLMITTTGGTTFNVGNVVGPQGTPGNGFSIGSVVNQMMYWNGSTWVILPAPSATGSVLTFCNGTLVWTIGGQCPQPSYPTGTIHCSSTPTQVIEVTNPSTGRIWMDRNLGASRVATSSSDSLAYGDLYQWGRRADGHQCRNSTTTSTLSSADQPSHGDFIIAPNSPFDWRSPQNTNLWQGVSGVNNPCPAGYRIPTEIEWNAERTSWGFLNSTGAFSSPLKLTIGGGRSSTDGTLNLVGNIGQYWTSIIGNNRSFSLQFDANSATTALTARAGGYAVRCIKQ